MSIILVRESSIVPSNNYLAIDNVVDMILRKGLSHDHRIYTLFLGIT